MRVLHIFPVSDIGGAENVSLNLMRYRERADIEHQAVLVTDEAGQLGEELARMGVPWTQAPRGRMRYPMALWRACLAVRHVVLNSMADLLLANSPQGFLYARMATIGLGRPVALYYMSVPRPHLWENNVLDMLMVLTRPAFVFTASRKIGQIVAGWGVPNVLSVHHGTAQQPLIPGALEQVHLSLAQYGVAPEDPIVVLPGRLQPWKGQHVLIAAWVEVLRFFPRAHAVLLGGSLFGLSHDYPQRLRQQITDLGLAERVHLVGHQSVRGWFARAAAVVHASIEPDPFPNVCIETLAARRPLITNTLSGTCEILNDKVNGLIVAANDPAALAMAIINVLSDPAWAERLAEAGFQLYQAACTPSHMVRPVEATLSGLVRQSSIKA